MASRYGRVTRETQVTARTYYNLLNSAKGSLQAETRRGRIVPEFDSRYLKVGVIAYCVIVISILDNNTYVKCVIRKTRSDHRKKRGEGVEEGEIDR